MQSVHPQAASCGHTGIFPFGFRQLSSVSRPAGQAVWLRIARKLYAASAEVDRFNDGRVTVKVAHQRDKIGVTLRSTLCPARGRRFESDSRDRAIFESKILA